MTKIYNDIDRFFREIRSVEIFRCDDLTFNGIYRNFAPSAIPIIVFDNINPEDFEQNIDRKNRRGSYFFSIGISFSIYNVNTSDFEKYNRLLNDKNFIITLQTNEDFMVIGNKYEPLRIEVFNKLKNNNSGDDNYEIQISGETIIEPRICGI